MKKKSGHDTVALVKKEIYLIPYTVRSKYYCHYRINFAIVYKMKLRVIIKKLFTKKGVLNK